MKKSTLFSILTIFLLVPATLLLGRHIKGRWYYLTSTLVIIEIMLPFFASFESRKPQSRELVTLAVMAALATASGAAAITYTVQALAQAGDHIVAQKTIYGGSYNLLEHTLPQYGISTTFVNVHDLGEVEKAIQDNTKAIYLETLGNPNSDIPDMDEIAAIAHKHGLPLVIDNTFGTPYLIRPI